MLFTHNKQEDQIWPLPVNLTSGLGAGSQQVDHVQVVADVDQDL